MRNIVINRSKNTSNPAVKVLSLMLLIISLLGACTSVLQKDTFRKTPETTALIVFVDIPFKTIDTGRKETVSFYQWIFESFRHQSGRDVVLFDDKTVVSRAMAKGIKPLVLYQRNNPFLKNNIVHLAFDETRIEKLCAMAMDLGASYLVKARLITNETKAIPRRRKQITWGPVTFRPVTFRMGKFDQMRAMTVEFTVYDIPQGNIILSREFSSTHTDSIGGWPVADRCVSTNLASAVIASLLSQKRSRIKPQQPSKVAINKKVKIEIPKFKGGRHFLEVRSVTLKSVTMIDNNLLRFDLSFRDYHDDRIKITFRHDANNRLTTYIVDRFGIRYYAMSSSLSGDSIDVRPGERKDIFFIFPMPATPVKQVNMCSIWGMRTPQRTHTFILKFKDVPLPFGRVK